MHFQNNSSTKGTKLYSESDPVDNFSIRNSYGIFMFPLCCSLILFLLLFPHSTC